jgi:hypothetical protein
MEDNLKIVFVWLTCVSSCFVITIGWYINLGIVTSIVQQMLGDLTGKALSLTSLVEYVAIAWGPLFDILIILWAIISSQSTDPTSRYG